MADESHRARYDAVIIGAGAAGLTAALGLAGTHGRRVAVVTKTATLVGGSSVYAQGGLAAAVGDDDTPSEHAADTLSVAGGIAVPAVVAALTEEGPSVVERLLALGTPFDRDADGRLLLGREAAHSHRRILHADGDATGGAIVRTLAAAVEALPTAAVLTRHMAHRLERAGGRVVGVRAVDGGGRDVVLEAPAVIVATGGIGRLFAHTTNPPENTGDGLAMGARAGAVLADLEFVQFHPTALALPGADPLPLLTEALRGEGAVLVDDAGRRFMTDVHPLAELAPRDVVARAIWTQLADGRAVFVDARAAVGDRFPVRFPTVFRLCQAAGLDPRRDRIPVAPAAHYHMGGLAVDGRGRTTVPGLWACGEVTSTGVHGANRLASNSLLEAIAFGGHVADDLAAGGEGDWPAVPADARLAPDAGAARGRSRGGSGVDADVAVVGRAADIAVGAGDIDAAGLDGARSGLDVGAVTAAIRRTAWEDVGLVRDAAGLAAAGRAFAAASAALAGRPPAVAGTDGDRPAAAVEAARQAATIARLEADSLALVGRLVAGAALARTESRGAHFRVDFPAADERWARRQFVRLAEAPDTPAADASRTAPASAAGASAGR